MLSSPESVAVPQYCLLHVVYAQHAEERQGSNTYPLALNFVSKCSKGVVVGLAELVTLVVVIEMLVVLGVLDVVDDVEVDDVEDAMEVVVVVVTKLLEDALPGRLWERRVHTGPEQRLYR